MSVPQQDKYAPLRRFLQDEMNVRNLSIREFAEFVGVTHTTIVRMLSERPEVRNNGPTLETILKIAAATHKDVMTLLTLAYPDQFAGVDTLSADARIIAQRLERLDPTIRKSIEKTIAEAAKSKV